MDTHDVEAIEWPSAVKVGMRIADMLEFRRMRFPKSLEEPTMTYSGLWNVQAARNLST